MDDLKLGQRWIEIRPGETPVRRLVVNSGVGSIVVPVQATDGFGEVQYAFGGLHADDGCEIWTPQSWTRH